MLKNVIKFTALILFLNGCNDGANNTDNAASSESVEIDSVIAILDVTVINVINGESTANMTVVVQGDQITEIDSNISIPENATQVDGSGKYLIPGLWDMHTHHEALGMESMDLYLATGVVGTRDMGSELQFILSLRDSINNGELLGPEIIAAGPILDDAPPEFPSRQRVSSAEEARQTVRDLQQSGIEFIKVHNLTPREVFFAIADETANLGMSFSGHVPLTVSIEEATSSGMTSIEHLSNFRVYLECAGAEAYTLPACQESFESLAASGIWQTPTIALYQEFPELMNGILNDIPMSQTLSHYEFASDALLERFETELSLGASAQIVNFIRANNVTSLAAINDLRESGNQFLAGCDALVPGFCLHDELQWMTVAGLSPLEALQTATINPAIFFGRENTQGTVEIGKRADLVLLDENPLTDINNIRKVNAVLVRGHLISKPFIEQILESNKRPSSN
jgi:hypothetical protein